MYVYCIPIFFLIYLRIVEKNPKKFKIDEQEIRDRRDFVERTKTTVNVSVLYLYYFKNILNLTHPNLLNLV